MSAIKTQIMQAEGHPKGSDEARVGMVIRRDGGGGVADTVSTADTASAGGPFSGGPEERTTLAEAKPAESSDTSSNTVTSIPDERAVWVSQRLRIRSTQNLVDVDPEGDTMPHVLVEGGGCGAAVPGAGPPHLVQPTATKEKTPETCQRHRTKGIRDSSSSATTVTWRGPRMRRKNHSSLTRTGTKAAPGPRRTKRKARVKAFDVRVEEYTEERRHVSHGGLSCFVGFSVSLLRTARDQWLCAMFFLQLLWNTQMYASGVVVCVPGTYHRMQPPPARHQRHELASKAFACERLACQRPPLLLDETVTKTHIKRPRKRKKQSFGPGWPSRSGLGASRSGLPCASRAACWHSWCTSSPISPAIYGKRAIPSQKNNVVRTPRAHCRAQTNDSVEFCEESRATRPVPAGDTLLLLISCLLCHR